MHALVVEDSGTIRLILTAYLKKLGFDVTVAVNGRDGLDQLHGMAKADVVLVDWNMPEMTGIEMVEAVRKESGLDSVKLMMVTTESELGQVEKAIGLGANEYVMKPFTKDVISGKLKLIGFNV